MAINIEQTESTFFEYLYLEYINISKDAEKVSTQIQNLLSQIEGIEKVVLEINDKEYEAYEIIAKRENVSVDEVKNAVVDLLIKGKESQKI